MLIDTFKQQYKLYIKSYEKKYHKEDYNAFGDIYSNWISDLFV